MNILLVEDNEMNRDMLSRRLSRRGYSVLTAVDGQAALDQIASTRPQLVLMDLSLPRIDGWEATRRLKANALTRDIPVIALSAHAMAQDRESALAAGCDDFDTKPVDIDRLVGKMDALLARDTSDHSKQGTALPSLAEVMQLDASSMQDLPAVMHLIERGCRSAGADAETLFSLRLAAEEVFTNILDYGYPDGTGPVTIRIDPQPGQVRISFADVAAQFDPAAVAAPNLDIPLEGRPIGGWGWYLVRQVMDRVEWKPRENGGNLFVLTKRLPTTAASHTGECR